MKIDNQTSLYGVVGFPIGHSLSPVMHNAAFAEKGMNAVYLAFETKDIQGCLQGIRALGIRGMSITIPHKSAVIPFLDEVDPLARKIGAVNTLVNDNGRLIGYNTDALGALKVFEEKIDLSGKSCILYGAGGAARAIGFVLREKGVSISLVNRSKKRAKELAERLGCSLIALNEVNEKGIDLLIQATPVGMYPHLDQCIVPEKVLDKDTIVMDVIYSPLETRLVKMAKARGCTTINGLDMFIYQGAEQFRLWTGVSPPLQLMNRIVEKALMEQAE
jgi:shikimate dehydrogenase